MSRKWPTPILLSIALSFFNTLSCDKLFLTITLPRNGTVGTAIQTELEIISLLISVKFIILGVDEKRMQTQALISAYFEGDPSADLIHVVTFPIPIKLLVFFICIM